MVNYTRTPIHELNTEIQEALQDHPELLEFYLSLPQVQQQTESSSTTRSNIPPSTLVNMIRGMKEFEEGQLKGIPAREFLDQLRG